MIIENVKHSMEISVARCSEGNTAWSRVLVLTCSASSARAAMKPPAVISRLIPLCSSAIPASTSPAAAMKTVL